MQVVTAIKKLGFHHVEEAALGADITLYREAQEWLEKTRGAIDSVMTFEELQAFVDVRSIDTILMVGMEMLGR